MLPCSPRRPGLAVFLVVAALVFVFVRGLPKGLWALIDLAVGVTLIYGGTTMLGQSPDVPPEG